MRLALAVALAAACGRSDAPRSIDRPAAPARTPTVIPATATELVVGVTADWTATQATLRRYRRAGNRWEPVGAPWPGVVGRTGIAWGAGLHGSGAPAGRDGPVKREGDGRSPAGAFALRGSYGYAAAAPAGTRLAYTPLVPEHACVDDPASTQYDLILDARTVAKDWTSAETMRRSDELYAWVVDVAHNPARTPGGGSCIFLHVWGGPRSTTSGCTAMAEAVLAELVATLDPSAIFVLLPEPEYQALAASWHLPPR